MASLDYDRDDDLDTLFADDQGALPTEKIGGLDRGFIHVLVNDGSGHFSDSPIDVSPESSGSWMGLGFGDLNCNGFVDFVTASNVRIPAAAPLVPTPAQYGALLDDTTFFTPLFAPTPDGFVWAGLELAPGELTVEINSGDNGNGWAAVTTAGSAGLTAGTHVNRDGIGAVVAFTPEDGNTVLTPIQGGSSFVSQHSLEATFGLGPASRPPHLTAPRSTGSVCRNDMSIAQNRGFPTVCDIH